MKISFYMKGTTYDKIYVTGMDSALDIEEVQKP